MSVLSNHKKTHRNLGCMLLWESLSGKATYRRFQAHDMVKRENLKTMKLLVLVRIGRERKGWITERFCILDNILVGASTDVIIHFRAHQIQTMDLGDNDVYVWVCCYSNWSTLTIVEEALHRWRGCWREFINFTHLCFEMSLKINYKEINDHKFYIFVVFSQINMKHS